MAGWEASPESNILEGILSFNPKKTKESQIDPPMVFSKIYFLEKG